MTITTTRRPAHSFDLRVRHVALALAMLFTVVGCTGGQDEPPPKAEPGPVPATQQRPGDAEAGYRMVVEGRYMTCGMPYLAWRRVAQPLEAIPTLPDRAAPNSDMPYFLTRHRNERGAEIVSTNCLSCHGATFNGELVIGLGNPYGDYTEDPRSLVDAIGTYVSSQQDVAAWREWARVLTSIAPYTITDTLGVNPAPNLTIALMAHQDPRSFEWYDEPRIEPPPNQPLPISVPPWWRMTKKHALFYNAMGRGDHVRFMMMKSLVCTRTVAEAERIDAAFTDVRAFIASLKPPEYPFAIDQGLAESGRGLFVQHCAACHGTYGDNAAYPNLVLPLEQVGTDPTYARKAYEDGDRFMDWFNGSWYGDIARARPALGYIAPPLDGVWATAPYLHNGSVPTIAALLDSDKRPTYWLRPRAEPPFDEETLGWKFTELAYGKDEASDPDERKRIYDTTLSGYSNAGHAFGNALTETERRAILEYLKTL